MGHRYKVREIAQQSGLSEATVDRVLNDRPGVRDSTRGEVRQAIADLDRQRTQLRLVGRKFLVDVVMQTPERFSSGVRAALEYELPSLAPAVVRSRFHFRETSSVPAMLETLEGIAQRGSHGVILKAPDSPEVAAAVDRLVDAKIPVVTFVTDIPHCRRIGYIGIDNRAAGSTAAYLIAQWLRGRRGNVLVSLSSSRFRGEEEREMGFRTTMRTVEPGRALIDVPGGDGLDRTTRELVLAVLRADPTIVGVYSIGGGNLAIVDAFDELGRRCEVFVAHDHDHDNARLLRDGRLSVVLHHDLNSDVRHACQLIMAAHGALAQTSAPPPSTIQVLTPYNAPPFTA